MNLRASKQTRIDNYGVFQIFGLHNFTMSRKKWQIFSVCHFCCKIAILHNLYFAIFLKTGQGRATLATHPAFDDSINWVLSDSHLKFLESQNFWKSQIREKG